MTDNVTDPKLLEAISQTDNAMDAWKIYKKTLPVEAADNVPPLIFLKDYYKVKTGMLIPAKITDSPEIEEVSNAVNYVVTDENLVDDNGWNEDGNIIEEEDTIQIDDTPLVVTDINDSGIKEFVSSSIVNSMNHDLEIYTILGYKFDYHIESKKLVKDADYNITPKPICSNFTMAENTTMPVKLTSPKYNYNKRLTSFDACSNKRFNREGSRVCHMRNSMPLCPGYEPRVEKPLYDLLDSKENIAGEIDLFYSVKGFPVYTVITSTAKLRFLELQEAIDYAGEVGLSAENPTTDDESTEVVHNGYCSSLISI